MLDAIAPMKALLQGSFIRLLLKDNKFQTYEAASKEEIDRLWSNILQVDKTLMPDITANIVIQQKIEFQSFVANHCKVRKYVFSIKKCISSQCNVCKPVTLPNDVYKSICHLPVIPTKSLMQFVIQIPQKSISLPGRKCCSNEEVCPSHLLLKLPGSRP